MGEVCTRWRVPAPACAHVQREGPDKVCVHEGADCTPIREEALNGFKGRTRPLDSRVELGKAPEWVQDWVLHFLKIIGTRTSLVQSHI